MKLTTALLITVLSGCASAAQSDGEATSSEEASVAADYERFLAELDQQPREKAQIDDVHEHLDPESLIGLRDLARSDEKARDSLFAKCGLLDVKNCFAATPRPVQRIVFKNIENGKKLACIAYSQQTADGGLIALVYMIWNGAQWLLVGTAQHEFDSPTFSRVGSRSESRCWTDGPG